MGAKVNIWHKWLTAESRSFYGGFPPVYMQLNCANKFIISILLTNEILGCSQKAGKTGKIFN